MTEFTIEVNGKQYSGRYRVDDDLTIIVTIDGKEERASLVQMRAAVEAVQLATKMIKNGGAPPGTAASPSSQV